MSFQKAAICNQIRVSTLLDAIQKLLETQEIAGPRLERTLNEAEEESYLEALPKFSDYSFALHGRQSIEAVMVLYKRYTIRGNLSYR